METELSKLQDQFKAEKRELQQQIDDYINDARVYKTQNVMKERKIERLQLKIKTDKKEFSIYKKSLKKENDGLTGSDIIELQKIYESKIHIQGIFITEIFKKLK